MIHHPGGFNLRLTARDCRAFDRSPGDDTYPHALAHRCDTRLGSSGAPLFSEELGGAIAIHHLGINRWHSNFAQPITAIAADSEIVARLSAQAPPTGP